MKRESVDESVCPLEGPLQVFASKWKPAILHHLFKNKVLRHGELLQVLEKVSQKVLTSQLRELERDGLVRRTVFNEIPARVEYEPTELAWSIRPIFVMIHQWNDNHMPTVRMARIQYDVRS